MHCTGKLGRVKLQSRELVSIVLSLTSDNSKIIQVKFDQVKSNSSELIGFFSKVNHRGDISN